VRFAESRRAVDEERVVRLARRFRDGVRRGSELVGLADDERLERVAFVERRRRDGRGGGDTPARARARGDEEIHLRAALPIFLHAEHDGRRPASTRSATRASSDACFDSFHSAAN